MTRLVIAAKFLSPATISLNGNILAEKPSATYLDFDVSALLAASGNELVVEFADGEKFTGLDGAIYLYHRAKPAASVWIKGGDTPPDTSRASYRVSDSKDVPDSISLFVPAEWKDKYRVRLYMEGKKDVPKGVKVRDRFVRKHHHNYGNTTDIDITDLLRFGDTNRIDIGANSPDEFPDKTSLKPLSILRIDLYEKR